VPALQTLLNELNTHYSREGISKLVQRRQEFAEAGRLGVGLLVKKGTPLQKAWQRALADFPGSFHVSIRAIINYALSTTPPTQITFAWAPHYDYELNVWQAPDTAETSGGITILIKSRYPTDVHPLKAGRTRGLARRST
jgi:hypothetical protein